MSQLTFLQSLFHGLPDTAWLEFAALWPTGRAGAEEHPSPLIFNARANRAPDLRKLALLNQQGYGIHYGLTAKARPTRRGHRSREGDAAWCTVLWVDIDLDTSPYANALGALTALQMFTPCPTAIVWSGGGYQALWRITPLAIDEALRPRLRAILRGLALALGGDTACAELSRMFRLPGTLNTKPKRHQAECKVIELRPWEYVLETFAEYERLGAPPPKPAEAQPAMPIPADGRLHLPGWVLRYLAEGRPEGQRNRTLYGAAIEYRAAGYSYEEAERDLLARGLADGLDEHEIRATIRSAWQSNKGTPTVSRHISARLRKPWPKDKD